jgi:hypothetical protein
MNCDVAIQCIEFTWQGFDEGDEVSGRGHASIGNGELHGHLYIHQGDDSAFRAARNTVVARKSASTRRKPASE